MTIAETTRPKVLRKLVIDEFSFVDAPASVGSDVLVWKRDGSGRPIGAARPAPAAAVGNPLPPGDRLAKLEADIASTRANRRVDELHEALAKGDTARGRELLRDPETYNAYKARLAGERYAAPVRLAEAEPDHRAAIREAVAGGDHAELTRLFRSAPAAHGQYQEMLRAGERAEAAETAVAKRSRTPAQVPAVEVNRWRERIRAMLEARDRKGLDAARRRGGAAFEAAWVAMATAGERMTM